MAAQQIAVPYWNPHKIWIMQGSKDAPGVICCNHTFDHCIVRHCTLCACLRAHKLQSLKRAHNVHRKKNIEHIFSVAAIKKSPGFHRGKERIGYPPQVRLGSASVARHTRAKQGIQSRIAGYHTDFINQ